jgi:WD40 repeat protein
VPLLLSWATFSPDGSALAVSSCRVMDCASPVTSVLRASDGSTVQTVSGGRNAVFSPDGKLVLAGGTVTDLATGATRALPMPAEVSLFAPDWTIYAASSDGQIRIFCPEM